MNYSQSCSELCISQYTLMFTSILADLNEGGQILLRASNSLGSALWVTTDQKRIFSAGWQTGWRMTAEAFLMSHTNRSCLISVTSTIDLQLIDLSLQYGTHLLVSERFRILRNGWQPYQCPTRPPLPSFCTARLQAAYLIIAASRNRDLADKFPKSCRLHRWKRQHILNDIHASIQKNAL